MEDEKSKSAPFSYIIKKLSNRIFSEPAAVSHWKKILDNKKDMESKLGRRVAIETAAMDYFLSAMHEKTGGDDGKHKEWLNRIYTPSYHIEKMQEEVMRAKRYNHALSAIMLDVDDFSRINDEHSFAVGDEILSLIVKIIRKSIRTVDIISRYSGDIFLIILPNTNKREAIELAERIRQNIPKRTRRISQLSEGITVTLSVSQCEHNENATDFIKKMETLLKTGKQKQRDAVYPG